MKLATKIRGFLRWNTVFFNTLAILAYGIALIGSIVVAAFAATDQEQRRSPGSTNPAVTRGAKGIIKAALFLQLLIILAFVVIVGRFHQISSSWHLSDCDELRKRNWKALLMVIVIDCVVMLVSSNPNYPSLQNLSLAGRSTWQDCTVSFCGTPVDTICV